MEAARKLHRALTRDGIPARLYENVGVIELIQPEFEHSRKFVDLNEFANYEGYDIAYVREHFNRLIITFNINTVIFGIRQSDFSSVFDELFTTAIDNSDVDYSIGYTVPLGTVFMSITENDDSKRMVKFYDHDFNENVAARKQINPFDEYIILPRRLIEKIGNICIIGNYFVSGADLDYSAKGGSCWIAAHGQNWQYIEEVHGGDRYLINEHNRIPMKDLGELIIMPNQSNGLYNNCVIEDDKKYECIYEHEGTYFAWDVFAKTYVQLKARRLGGRTKAAIRDI